MRYTDDDDAMLTLTQADRSIVLPIALEHIVGFRVDIANPPDIPMSDVQCNCHGYNPEGIPQGGLQHKQQSMSDNKDFVNHRKRT